MLPSYSLLRQDARPDHWRAMYIEGIAQWDLIAGIPIETAEDPVRVTLSPEGRLRSDFLERPCPVVSDAMRRVLDRCGVDNVQYFRAELQMEYSDEIWQGFWVANVIGAVACVDSDRSTFVRSGGTLELQGFLVDPAKAHGLSVFRLGEDKRVIVIDERIRHALQAASLSGLLIQETQTYNGYPVNTAEAEPDAEEPPGA